MTAQEKAIVAALRKLERNWPKNLWLFAGDGTLYLMRKSSDGERMCHANSGVDQKGIIASFHGIEADGGGW